MFEWSSLQGSSRQTLDLVTQVLLSAFLDRCVFAHFRTLPWSREAVRNAFGAFVFLFFLPLCWCEFHTPAASVFLAVCTAWGHAGAWTAAEIQYQDSLTGISLEANTTSFSSAAVSPNSTKKKEEFLVAGKTLAGNENSTKFQNCSTFYETLVMWLEGSVCNMSLRRGKKVIVWFISKRT